MKVSKEFMMKVQEYGFKELWDEYEREHYNKEVPFEEINKVRFGFKLKMDIFDIIEGNYGIKSKTGEMIYRGRSYQLSDFYTEKGKRNAAMKNRLYEIYEIVKPTRKRGGNAQ